MSSGIYQIRNTVNNKQYIGSAVNLNKRWKEHRLALRKGIHHSVLLQRAWNKYTEDSFEFRIIEECEKAGLIKREQYYLDSLNPEYNVCKIAGSQRGMKRSVETKKKMSIVRKGRKLSVEWIENISRGMSGENHPGFGKHRSEETKRKISETRIAKCLSAGQNNPMSKTSRFLRNKAANKR